MLIKIIFVLLFGAAVVPPGTTTKVDLDADGQPESLIVKRQANGLVPQLGDTCGLKPVLYPLAPPANTVRALRAVEADGDFNRPEILISELAGARPDGIGVLRVLRYDDSPTNGPGCQRPKVLFSYRSDHPASVKGYATLKSSSEIVSVDGDRPARITVTEILRAESKTAPVQRRQRRVTLRYSKSDDQFVVSSITNQPLK